MNDDIEKYNEEFAAGVEFGYYDDDHSDRCSSLAFRRGLKNGIELRQAEREHGTLGRTL